jgi:flagellar export protein FliJ
MGRFHFRLQPLLDRREREESEAHAALLAAARTRARERERAAELRAERARVARRFTSAGANLEPGAIRELFTHLDLLAAGIARQDTIEERACDREAASRATWAAARREHRRLMMLRERAHAAYVADVECREERALDDANASNRNAPVILLPSSFHN